MQAQKLSTRGIVSSILICTCGAPIAEIDNALDLLYLQIEVSFKVPSSAVRSGARAGIGCDVGSASALFL